MQELRFDMSQPDLVERIAYRAMEMRARANPGIPRRRKQEVMMDIAAAKASIPSLDLNRLANADDFNFAHDVFGIERHLNRETGQIENMFLPRCAR